MHWPQWMPPGTCSGRLEACCVLGLTPYLLVSSTILTFNLACALMKWGLLSLFRHEKGVVLYRYQLLVILSTFQPDTLGLFSAKMSRYIHTYVSD